MKKKFILVFAVIFVLSGCGNVAAPGESGELASASIETSAEAEEEPEESPETEESREREEPTESSVEESRESEEASESKEVESGKASGEEKVSGNLEKPSEPKEPADQKEPAESTASQSRETGNSEASAEEKVTATPTPAPVQTAAASTPTPAPTATPKPEAVQPHAPEQTPQPTPTPQPVHTCSWDGGKVTQAATCSSEGVMTYTCTSCGNTRTESIAKTDHSFVWNWNLEDDLGNCNYRERTVDMCSVCGYILNTYTDDIMVIHSMSEPVKEGGPLCTVAITTTYTCSKCGLVESSREEPRGHQEADWRPGGYCMYCGEHIFHKYVEGMCFCGAVQEGYVEASTPVAGGEELVE